MSGRYLLDTNIIIALFADDASVRRNIEKAGEIFTSSITIGELCFGALKSNRPAENLARIEDFAANIAILNCDTDTGRRHGEIEDALRIKGRPLPENDVWVASIARQNDLSLVTRDAHFNEISDLRIVAW